MLPSFKWSTLLEKLNRQPPTPRRSEYEHRSIVLSWGSSDTRSFADILDDLAKQLAKMAEADTPSRTWVLRKESLIYHLCLPDQGRLPPRKGAVKDDVKRRAEARFKAAAQALRKEYRLDTLVFTIEESYERSWRYGLKRAGEEF